MRCRERDNPFTKFGQDLFPLHAAAARFSRNHNIARASRPCYNSNVSRVLMISSEAAPFAKTGGLADVVGALSGALHAFGDEVAVVIPRYGSIDLKSARRVWENLFVHLGSAAFPITIYQAPAEYPVYLVDC